MWIVEVWSVVDGGGCREGVWSVVRGVVPFGGARRTLGGKAERHRTPTPLRPYACTLRLTLTRTRIRTYTLTHTQTDALDHPLTPSSASHPSVGRGLALVGCHEALPRSLSRLSVRVKQRAQLCASKGLPRAQTTYPPVAPGGGCKARLASRHLHRLVLLALFGTLPALRAMAKPFPLMPAGNLVAVCSNRSIVCVRHCPV